MTALRIAVVDGGSFVLPHDHGLVTALVRAGHAVTVFASRTRYNAAFLDAMAELPGVQLRCYSVSGSVAPRWRGLLAAAALLRDLWIDRAAFGAVWLQFSILPALEWPLWWALRQRLFFAVHNAVPHGHVGLQHGPTRRIAQSAHRLVFISAATRVDFLRRYGTAFAPGCRVWPHGLLATAPGQAPLPVRALPRPEALVFWGTVKAYKGVALFAELARSPALRASGIGLEIHGRWDAGLHGLRSELQALGVRIEDRFLDAAELQRLMARPVLFLLPYIDASQSGALYTLLHQGCTFASSDAGDLGDFHRRFGLQALLLAQRDTASVQRVLANLQAQADDLAQALQRAQQQSAWTLPADLAGELRALTAEHRNR